MHARLRSGVLFLPKPGAEERANRGRPARNRGIVDQSQWGKEGGLIAQGLDCPAIMVTDADKAQIRKNPETAISGYAEAFPEGRKDFSDGGKMRRSAFQ